MMQFSSAAEMGLQPQEYEVISAILHKKLVLGVPKETAFQENRVAITPQAVQLLVSRGNEVMIESEAGVSSFFSDMDYSKAGATIVYSAEEVYKAHVIVKVSPVPEEDLKLLKPGQIIFSVLNLPNLAESYLRTLLEKKITCIAFEYLKDSIGNLPIVRSMSEIAGSTSMLIAAEYLSNQYSGCGKLLGGITGIPPSKVVILGAGTVGGTGGTNFNAAWLSCSSLTSFPLINTAAGTIFTSAWQGCTSLTSFPALNFSSAATTTTASTGLASAWQGCTALTTFPANVFDNCQARNYTNAFLNCALTEASVDNILVSIAAAAATYTLTGGTLNMTGGTSSAPSATGNAAKTALQTAGWTVTTN
jgi:hypothetical protein